MRSLMVFLLTVVYLAGSIGAQAKPIRHHESVAACEARQVKDFAFMGFDDTTDSYFGGRVQGVTTKDRDFQVEQMQDKYCHGDPQNMREFHAEHANDHTYTITGNIAYDGTITAEVH